MARRLLTFCLLAAVMLLASYLLAPQAGEAGFDGSATARAIPVVLSSWQF